MTESRARRSNTPVCQVTMGDEIHEVLIRMEYGDITSACIYRGWWRDHPQSHIDHSARWKHCKHMYNTYIVHIDKKRITWEESPPATKATGTATVTAPLKR